MDIENKEIEVPKHRIQKSIWFTPESVNIAWESIKLRAMERMGRPENFSEYVASLILEEWKRNKERVKEMLEKEKGS